MSEVATPADPGRVRAVHGRPGRSALYALAIAPLLLTLTAVDPARGHRPCEPPPPAVRDLEIAPPAPMVADKPAAGEIEPLIVKRPVPAAAIVARFLDRIATDADRAWAPVRSEVARRYAGCAASWLEAWAREGALLGVMRSRQAEIRREYDFAGIAVAYLKVRSRTEDAARKVIEPWLINLADAVQGAYEKRRPHHNHRRYWLGLALGAVGVGADSDRHWKAGRDILAEATAAIAGDGTLAAELARKGRALHYHAFALTPLIVLAELAAARGDDAYAARGGALHRLVGVVSEGLADPVVFQRRTGTAQDANSSPGWGWLSLYAARFPDRAPKLAREVPTGHAWIGGDAHTLVRALAPGT